MMPIQMISVTPGDAPPATFYELLARDRVEDVTAFDASLVAAFGDPEMLP